ncbi:MAG: hypothetical protein SV375_21935, partial [Thermodesulfobacteriota bacterium]|nr:hypothetical protein [Thermodesulfobacteriota bacterium]
MKKDTILFFVGSRNKGFLVSLAILMSKRFDIVFIAEDKDVVKILKKLCNNINKSIVERKEVASEIKFDRNDIISECLKREKKYNIHFSTLCSHERGLGKGYIFNADKHPDIIRAWWTMEKKYAEILKNIIFYEYLVEKNNPKIIFSNYINTYVDIISNYYNIKKFALVKARFGDRYLWVDSSLNTSGLWIKRLKQLVDENFINDEKNIYYEQDQASEYAFSKFNYSYVQSIKNALRTFLQ